ncbi:MAG: DNA-binding YbaB/EbfC family protein [Limisphaerales bacterium]|jgi:DNA-binding YbaB/EbfC family protein
MANINKLMKQAAQMQQKMQDDMAATQEELASRTVEASAGGDTVKVVATCGKVIQSVEIKPEAIDPEEREFLQDLIRTATNEALEKAEAVSAEEMGKITAGMNLPGMGGGLPGF